MIPEKADFPKHIRDINTTEPRRNGKFFLIVGPSGVGKTTLASALTIRHPEFAAVPPVTTRPRRLDDIEGKPYRFVSDEGFEALDGAGELSETCTYCGYRYGMLGNAILRALEEGAVPIQENVIYDWHALAGKYPDWHVRTVFLLPPSIDILAMRIRARSPLSEEQIRLRMESATIEMQTAHLADLRVVSEEGQQEKVYETVERYILSELESNRP